MVVLREPNNPNTDVVIMGVLRNTLNRGKNKDTGQWEYNTKLAALSASQKGTERVFIQNRFKMSQGDFPAVHLEAGDQTRHRNSLRTYMGMTVVDIDYYDRWDTSPDTIDGLRADISADLERIIANIEDNDSLAYQGRAFAISIPDTKFSPYKGEFDTTFPGLTLVYRRATIFVNVLPYLVG
jgi:hypothetical protein